MQPPKALFYSLTAMYKYFAAVDTSTLILYYKDTTK
nr:MAG TPA_asm: hypothetical protein [Caudoviricetes sp.]